MNIEDNEIVFGIEGIKYYRELEEVIQKVIKLNFIKYEVIEDIC